MATVINLNQSNQVDYKGQRQGNAFGFDFDLFLNDDPIVADDYSCLGEIYLAGKKVLSIYDDEWTKTDNNITKLWDSLPLNAGDYEFHCTLTNTSNQQVTYVNGTIQIIERYRNYTGTENNETIQANVNAGIPGPQGEPGVGVPEGGTAGQVLAKIDGTDYNTEWVDQSGGGGGGGTWGSITGTLSDQTDLQAALDALDSDIDTVAASLVSHTSNTSNPHSVTKSQVGLGSVDNTSDANKPVSTAQQSAIDLKANIASPTFTGTVSGITKSMVGLGSVDNTADTAKPVSTAQQTALDAKLNLAGGTMTGSITLSENTGIALDPAGSADGKWSGITIAATAGYTQAFGDVVYLDPTDSRWEQCDANSASAADGDSRGIIGIVVSTGTDGTACTILLRGIIRADAKFPTLTINGPVYVSETAGSLTQTAPSTSGAVVRRIGTALTADEIFFNPSEMYLTVM